MSLVVGVREQQGGFERQGVAGGELHRASGVRVDDAAVLGNFLLLVHLAASDHGRNERQQDGYNESRRSEGSRGVFCSLDRCIARCVGLPRRSNSNYDVRKHADRRIDRILSPRAGRSIVPPPFAHVSASSVTRCCWRALSESADVPAARSRANPRRSVRRSPWRWCRLEPTRCSAASKSSARLRPGRRDHLEQGAGKVIAIYKDIGDRVAPASRWRSSEERLPAQPEREAIGVAGDARRRSA